MLKFHQTIRGKLVIMTAITVICLAVVLDTWMLIKRFETSKQVSEQYLYDSLLFLSTSLSQSLWDYDLDTVKASLESMMGVDYVANVTLTDEKNQVIYTFEKNNLMDMSNYLLTATREVSYNNHIIGTIELTVSSYFLFHEAYNEMLRDYLMTFLTLVIVLLLIFYYTDNITRPMRRLEEITQHIAEGKLNNTIHVKGNDEVGALAKAILAMQDQLRENRDRMMLQMDRQEDLNDQLKGMVDEINKSYKTTILALANAIEANDEYTRGHCDRVLEYAMLIAGEIDLSDSDRECLQYAAVLHDIGKIGVPLHILNKESPPTKEDFESIKKHPKIGYDIIKDIPFLERSAKVVLHHHERIDGLGYPEGLKGAEIDLLSQILCVADAYDAMTSIRPYRKIALDQEAAIIELTKCAGTQFNPEIVDRLVSALKKRDLL